MDLIIEYLEKLWSLTLEMSPYLLLGFVIAGLLHTYIPKKNISKWMGGYSFRSTLNATLIGVPMPLCSCGVIPTGISLYKNGASRSSALSFLISTPQTGVDSILVTYSLLGLPLAIARPFIAGITGIIAGITNSFVEKNTDAQENDLPQENVTKEKEKSWRTVFQYGFIEMFEDIGKWLVIGLLLAALISIVVPEDFFVQYYSSDLLEMLSMLVISIPLYVCATASVPIAAVLMGKGLSMGATLVFLMAGPATNLATITVLSRSLGHRSFYVYLITIIVGSLAFGALLNLLPETWFLISSQYSGHTHLIPYGVQVVSSVILLIFLFNALVSRFINFETKTKQEKSETISQMEKKIMVNNMECNHCKRSVETMIQSIDGIEKAEVDLPNKIVTIHGADVNLNLVREAVEKIGYDYQGEAT